MTEFTRKRGVMRSLKTVVAILLTCALASSCEDPPTGPSTTRVPPPPPPVQPVVTGLELTGQTTIAPGATSQFTLIAVFSDGTRTDVTNTAQWSIGNERYISSLGQGRFRAEAHGESTVQARYTGRISSREIVVVPDGTFRVTGRIVEEDGATPDRQRAHPCPQRR